MLDLLWCTCTCQSGSLLPTGLGSSALWHLSLAQEHTIAMEPRNHLGTRDGAVVKKKQQMREDQIIGEQQQILGCSVTDLGIRALLQSG